MKIINSLEEQIPSYVLGIAEDLSKQVISALQRDYEISRAGDYFSAQISIEHQLTCVLAVLELDLEGKRIFDLGCGAARSYDNFEWEKGISFIRDFEPWFCRALYELQQNPQSYGFQVGPHPIGIDVAPLHGERFENYQANLAQADCLLMIPQASIDVANAYALFNSPTFERLKGEDFEANFFRQLERVLKPDGILVTDSSLYH